MAQFSSVPPRSIFTGQKLVLRARLTLGTELGSGTEFRELAQFSSVPPRSIFTGQKLVLRALGTLGPGSLFLLLVLWGVSLSSTMGTMTFWDRIPRIGPIPQRAPQEHFHRTKTRFKGAFDFRDRTGFWDRIPRIGQILQRTPQEHFHRTKTCFKGAFDFGDRTGFWDRIPRIGPILQRTPQEHFHRTKTRFKGAFDFGDRTGPWLFILITSTMGNITFQYYGDYDVLGQNSPNWPNSPAYPPGAFSPDKNSF